jgi:chromatin remodeling complex protein RSC6
MFFLLRININKNIIMQSTQKTTKRTPTVKKTVKPVAVAPNKEVKVKPVEVPVEIIETVETVEESSLAEKIISTLSFVSLMIKELKTVESELKTIKSLYHKESRKNVKKPKRQTNTGSHGFVKKVKISIALADFLEVPYDTLISRPQVTSAISKYVKAHNLANPEKKSIFKTDENLKKILGEPRYPIDKKKPDLGEGFSYFNLQSYMKDHFVKETPVA